MIVELENISKKYNELQVFQNISYKFYLNNIYGIKGNNGAGKSTLLKIINNIVSPTEGKIIYNLDNKKIENNEIYKYISFCAPYIEFFNELKCIDLVNFHFSFKNIIKNIEIGNFFDITKIDQNSNTTSLSTGTLQRLILATTILTDSKILVLDEPTENLDIEWKNWTKDLILEYSKDRIVIVASNNNEDLSICNSILDINNYN